MNKERVSWNLLTTGNGHGQRFYINGKRVSRLTYRNLVDEATRLECFHSETIAGTSYQRCVAVLEA